MPWLPVLHTHEEDIGWFRKLLAGEAWIFEEDGEPVGYAAMKDGELHDLYVAPECPAPRRGLRAVRARAGGPSHGFRFWAFRDNTRARSFYEARGCVVVDSSDDNNEEKLPDVQYEWCPGLSASA